MIDSLLSKLAKELNSHIFKDIQMANRYIKNGQHHQNPEQNHNELSPNSC